MKIKYIFFILGIIFLIIVLPNFMFNMFNTKSISIGHVDYLSNYFELNKIDIGNTRDISLHQISLFTDDKDLFIKVEGQSYEGKNIITRFYQVKPDCSSQMLPIMNHDLNQIKEIQYQSKMIDSIFVRKYFKEAIIRWNKYKIRLTIAEGCPDTSDSEITISSLFRKIIIKNLGNVKLYYYDINRDNQKDLLIVNQYACEGTDELYCIYYKR